MNSSYFVKDFYKLYDNLNSSLKREFPFKKFSYSKKCFEVVLDSSDMEKITTANIVIFNNKTEQYRVFKYVSGNCHTEMLFKCEDITLIIKVN